MGSETVADVSDVAEIDGGIADDADGKIAEFGYGAEAGVDADVIFEFADFRGAGGKDDVLLLNGEKNVLRGKAFGLEKIGVEVDHDLALFAPVGIRNDGAGNGD